MPNNKKEKESYGHILFLYLFISSKIGTSFFFLFYFFLEERNKMEQEEKEDIKR